MVIPEEKLRITLTVVTALAVLCLVSRSLIMEGSALLVIQFILGASFIILLWIKRFYVFSVFLSLAAININLVGIDPGDILIPILLIIGLSLGYLNINDLRFPTALKYFFGLFAFFYVISIVTGDYGPPYVVHLISNVAFLCFLKLYIDSERRMRHVLLAILSGAIFTSIVAIGTVVGLFSPSAFSFEIIRDFRYMSLLGDPNILAIQTVLIALWLFDELMAPKLLKISPWVPGTLLMFALAQIALTQSRSGWLNLMVSLGCYIWWDVAKGRIRKVLKMSICVVAILSTIIALLFMMGQEDILMSRFDSLVVHDSQAEEERFNLFFTRKAIDLAIDHPLGVGAGLTGESLGITTVDGDFIGAHNTYIQVLSDNGWGAFFAFLGMLVIIGRSLVLKIKDEGVQFGLSYQFLFSGLVGLTVNGMFQDLIEWQVAWILPALATVVLWPKRRV